MAKKPARTDGPLTLILPALVFGLGIAAMWIGIPKEISAHKLSSGGVNTQAKVVSIEHQKNKSIVNLSYEVKGQDFPLVSEQVDSSELPSGHPRTTVTYAPNDPSIATADLPGDSKLATEYLLAGALELTVGGWFTLASLRRRRAALARKLAEKI